MYQYINLVKDCLANGITRTYRNGDRQSVFSKHLTFDLSDGFPLVTIKKTHYRAAFDEILWMLSGSTNINGLKYKQTWKQWSYKDNIGPIYGHSYRHYPNKGVPIRKEYLDHPDRGIAPDVDVPGNKQYSYLCDNVDQLWELIRNLKETPTSSRHRMAIYNPGTVPDNSLTPTENVEYGKGALTACNVFQQYTTIPYEDTYKLSLHITQASSDILIGLCYNIAQFALLLSIIAKEVNMVPDKLYIGIGDAHIYANQLSTLEESNLLSRTPRGLSSLSINPDVSIWSLKHDDFLVTDYKPHTFVKLPVSL